MQKQLLHTPEGVRDIYNSECEKKLVLQKKLHEVLNIYGYHHIETPTFEFFDVFSREVGTISSRELYKFFDREGNTLVLRPDFTPSIARAAVKYFVDEDMPVRLSYMGNTFINHTSYQGRLKETTQLGAELIGDNSVSADAEMIALVIDLLLKTGLKEFQVSIGQLEYFKSLLRDTGIDEETEMELRRMISHKNNFGIEELMQEKGIDQGVQKAILNLPQLFGSVEILEKAKSLTGNPAAIACVERLEAIYQTLTYYGLEKYVSFDLGMLSKYNYYTGIIFRAYTFGTGDAIVKGGRYDSLLGHFGKDAPSIGFAVVVDQLMMALSRQKIQIKLPSKTTLLLYEAQEEKTAIALAVQYRKSGMRIELLCKDADRDIDSYKAYGERNKMGGILYFAGHDQAQILNLAEGTQQTVDLKSLS